MLAFPLSSFGSSSNLEDLFAAFDKWKAAYPSIAPSSVNLSQAAVDKLLGHFKEVRLQNIIFARPALEIPFFFLLFVPFVDILLPLVPLSIVRIHLQLEQPRQVP